MAGPAFSTCQAPVVVRRARQMSSLPRPPGRREPKYSQPSAAGRGNHSACAEFTGSGSRVGACQRPCASRLARQMSSPALSREPVARLEMKYRLAPSVLNQGSASMPAVAATGAGAGADQAPARQRLHISCHPEKWLSRSEEHTSELQSLMRISYAVFCLKKKK